jgi:uncharacterized protein (UPF0332 family)
MTSRATPSFEAIDPSSYLALAIDLAETQTEAARRSAVDRAYYAAFLTVRDTLVEKGYASFPARSQAHVQAAEALNQIIRAPAQELAILRRARNRLTYQPGRQTLPRGQSIAELLDSARAVIDEVRSLPGNR